MGAHLEDCAPARSKRLGRSRSLGRPRDDTHHLTLCLADTLSKRHRRASREQISHRLGSRDPLGIGDHMINVMDIGNDAPAAFGNQEGPDS